MEPSNYWKCAIYSAEKINCCVRPCLDMVIAFYKCVKDELWYLICLGNVNICHGIRVLMEVSNLNHVASIFWGSSLKTIVGKVTLRSLSMADGDMF